MNNNKKYRLIWFHHFHKAAGTTMVYHAKNNGEGFWDQNINGNPSNHLGEIVPIWNYCDADLSNFIDECESKSVTFVATEWGLPNLDLLVNDERVMLITCIRDPLERFLSNYYFDVNSQFVEPMSIYQYSKLGQNTTMMDNYYCRELSRTTASDLGIDDESYESAIKALKKFDYCFAVENGFEGIENRLSWQVETIRANAMWFSRRYILKVLLQGNWKSAYIRLRYKKRPATQKFAQFFFGQNFWDIKLYAAVLNNKL